MTVDFIQTIKSEHQRANEILDRLADTSDGTLKRRERLSEQLAGLVAEHAHKEEALLYPALQQHRVGQPRRGNHGRGQGPQRLSGRRGVQRRGARRS